MPPPPLHTGLLETLDDLDASDGALRGLGAARHFSYYAAEAASGEERWHHTPLDFRRELSDDDRLRPQNQVKWVRGCTCVVPAHSSWAMTRVCVYIKWRIPLTLKNPSPSPIYPPSCLPPPKA